MSELSTELREIRAMTRDFAAAEIAPHAQEWNATKTVPVETLRTMASLGLFGVNVPEELGGAGLGTLGLCVVMEELAAADAGTSTGLAAQCSLTIPPIVNFGSDAQRREWVPALASGERFGAYALSEADHGSDAAGLTTSASEVGGGFAISGSKLWITNGGFADVFIVFARTDGPGASGVSAFIVEKDSGVKVGREIPKMGLHTSSTVELAFDGVEVPRERVLGERRQGMRIAFSTLDAGRIVIAGQAVGIARAALELATRYAAERTAFGGPIARFQGVQFPIADVAAKIDAARVLTHRAARIRDAGEPCTEIGAKAKLFASSVAVEAANVAVQTLGGYGYSAEFPAERYYRDAKITELYEGTSEIQRLVIARQLMGDAARG
ncbi:MAG: acyl-CoA dehydrogenase family protein [Thermoleophilia bacterium]|nr:acyl-CoA dehydrogenase family protein [Thermoleophilia bacterium]MDH3725069.1 acyl-CoA dehydrogenase family protein [Thermoleophilia bacterium]